MSIRLGLCARRHATLLNRIAFRFETGGKRAAEVIHLLRLLGLRVGLRIVLLGIVSRRLSALPSNRAQGCADSLKADLLWHILYLRMPSTGNRDDGRVFETVEIGRQMVVKAKPAVSENQTPVGKELVKAARFPVTATAFSRPTLRLLVCALSASFRANCRKFVVRYQGLARML